MKLIYRCANIAEASVILNVLFEAGIPAVDGESGTSSVFPLPNFGPTIYVDDENVDRAVQILKELEKETQWAENNESFREVDREEIDYLKTVHTHQGNKLWVWIVVLILLVGLLRAVFYAQGQGDWFSRKTQNNYPYRPGEQFSSIPIQYSSNSFPNFQYN